MAKKSIIKINEIWKIKQDIQHLEKELTNQLINKAEDNMVSAFKSIINDFYNNYSPSSYRRKRELTDALINHHVYKYSNNKARAVIKIGSNNMSNNYRISPDNILDLMWIQGIRGLPRQGDNSINRKFSWPISRTERKTWYPGEVWVNPFWSGEVDPYRNIFNTTIDIDGYSTPAKMKPHNIMIDFVNKWGMIAGNECDKIVKSII